MFLHFTGCCLGKPPAALSLAGGESALALPAVQARLAGMQARHAELCAELSSAPRELFLFPANTLACLVQARVRRIAAKKSLLAEATAYIVYCSLWLFPAENVTRFDSSWHTHTS